MRVLLNLVLSGMMLVNFVACGPGIDDDVMQFARQKWSIIGGQPDTSLAHRAVAAVYVKTPLSRGLCTGTLIGEDAILTAAHCCDSSIPTHYQILFGLDTTNAVSVKVSNVWKHPLYICTEIVEVLDDVFCLPNNDICLLRLAGNAPSGIQPIPNLPANLALTQDDEGETLVFVGYGLDNNAFDPSRGLGQRLSTTVALDRVCDEPADCGGIGFPIASHVLCHDNENTGACQGDSGGPAFVVRDGVEYVAGVTSYGDATCSIYGCSAKVDQFQEYIDGFVNSPQYGLGQACQDGYDCASGFCADGVCCDYACQSACEACNVAGSEGNCVRDPAEEGCKKESAGCNAQGQSANWPGWGWLVGLVGFVMFNRLRRLRAKDHK